MNSFRQSRALSSLSENVAVSEADHTFWGNRTSGKANR